MLQSIILIDPEAILAAKPGSNTLVIAKLEDKRDISIDQIRQLVGWAGQYGFTAGDKRAIILQAQQLSAPAANTLLKTLEEPTEQTTLLLTVDTASSLLPTIRSRCAIFQLAELPVEQLAGWGLQKRTTEETTIPIAWSAFLAQSALQRWQTIEQALKAKQDMTVMLHVWQQQLYQDLPGSSDESLLTNLTQASALDRARQDLQANRNLRLTFDELLLRLEGEG